MVDAPVGLPHAVMAWVPPPMNYYKVNWDVYRDSATKMWTTGILICDHRGQVLAAQCVNVQYHPCGVHPKFYACVHALMFALEMSFAEIIVEGPPFHPVDTLKNRSSGPTIGDSWLEEIWVLSQKFRRCSLSSVSPEINKGAWMLAKFGSTIKESKIWIEEVPVMLQDVL